MNKEKENWEVEFNTNLSDYIKIISVGQYDDKGVNVGFLQAKEVVKNFISQALQKRDAQIIEIIKNFNPEYGELGAAIPNFKERLISTLNTK